MDIDISAVEQLNITIVYDRLSIESLSRDKLRVMLPGEASQLIDLQKVVTILYPELQLACVIDERRITCNEGSRLPVGDRPLTALARKAHDAARNHGKQIAFGFNYHVRGTIKGIENVSTYLTDKFASSPPALKECLGAEDLLIIPHLIFTRGPARYTLQLEQTSDSEGDFTAHLNVHYETSQFPTIVRLDTLFRQEYDAFVESVLCRL